MLSPRLMVFAALGFLGCGSKRTFEMTSEITGKTCAAQNQSPAEEEVRLRYAHAPKHYVVICSNAVAGAIRASARPTVPMVLRRHGGAGSAISVCEVAGLKADAPGTECTFNGTKLAGWDSVPGRDADQTPKPTPWGD